MVSDSYIASYLFPYFLCRSLLPFLNSKLFKTLVSLSTVVFNSKDRHEKHGVLLLCASITRLTIYLPKKLIEMY